MTLIARLRERTPLGWLQLRHDRGRLLVAVAGIAFADVLMFTQLGFQASIYDANTRFHRALNADIVLISPKAQNLQNLSTFPRRRLLQARDVPGVVDAQGLYVSTLTWKNPDTRWDATVQMFGFDPDARVFTIPEVLSQQHKLKLPDTVLFDRGARGPYKRTIATLEQGQSLSTEAERRTLQIAGLFPLGASFGSDGTVMASDLTFLRQFPRRNVGSLSLGLLRLQPGANADLVAEHLRRHLPDDVKVFTRDGYIAFEQAYWRRASPVGVIFGMGTVMAFIVGVVIVYQVLSTDVASHLGEYATFRAMGYRNRYLLGVVFEQALVLASLGYVPGFVFPIGIYALASKATFLPIAMTAERAIRVFLLTLLMCIASGSIATRRLQAADPAELF
ncbi:MAG: ABC transporter permease DevC [Cyanobacteriota bacterium]|nr:ABC transporter permease DevC [Cyanobacteriota bacterium]